MELKTRTDRRNAPPPSAPSSRTRRRPMSARKRKLNTTSTAALAAAAMIAVTTEQHHLRPFSHTAEAFGNVMSLTHQKQQLQYNTQIFYTTSTNAGHRVDDLLQYPIHFFQHASSTDHQQQPQYLSCNGDRQECDDDEVEDQHHHQPQQHHQRHSNQVVLPTWLRLSRAHLADENMESLREAMLNSFFTETEVLKLTYAIREASNGNADMIAGTAEFCLIMVETMEMGLNALIAGAFHYCSCVEARQKQMLLPAYDDPLSPWEFSPHQGLESFGDHVMQIERDAHRLKRLEVLASMVVQNSNSNAAATTTTSSISDPSTTAAANLQNLYMTEARDWRALAIRGAACLYRLRGIIKSMSPAHQLSRESNRVCREALHIYAPLASRLGMHRLKNELEHAAFRLLYKRQHRTVESLLHQRRQRGHSSEYKDVKDGGRLLARVHQADGQLVQSNELVEQPDIGESMEQILEQVQKEMTEILENDAVFVSSVAKFEVSARVKEGYSTWRKMLRNGLDHILQVPDALALRIVLDAKKEWDGESVAVTRARERALCYYAQQLCMNVWRPYADNPRFKDYIAKPKENGYQSLHYTATTPFNGEQWMMEVQIRSGEMHKVAEFGVASHWNYKARSRSSSQMKKLQSFSSSQPSYRPNGSPIRIEMSPEEHFGKAMADHNTDAYLRSLQDWHWHQHGSPVDYNPLFLFDEAEHQERADRIRARTQRLAPYIEALASAQSDLQKQSVFVFLSAHHDEERNKDNANCSLLGDGMVVALPAGAVVMDAIRKCEFPDEVAARLEETVTHNGSPAILSTRLQNGDVLSIPAAAPCLTPV